MSSREWRSSGKFHSPGLDVVWNHCFWVIRVVSPSCYNSYLSRDDLPGPRHLPGC